MRAKNINEDLLDDVGIDKDKFMQSASISAKKLQQIKELCESSLEATNQYFEEIEEEDLDADERDNYVSNEAINNIASQILKIINK